MLSLVALSLGLTLGPLAPRCAAPTMVIEGSGVERLNAKTRALPKHKIPLPAALKRLGCDDDLWSKIRAKEAFVRLLDAGDEEGAKVRLEQVRNAPSVKGEQWKMPETLGAWGCDEELWSKIRSKRALLELERSGDEEAGRSRIAKIREAVAAEEAEAAAAPAKQPARKPRAPRSEGSKARPLSEGYTLDGEPPAGADVAEIEKLLAARVEAKLQKEYATADSIQEQLIGMGVYCNDRLRTWSSEAPATAVAK